MKPNRYQKWGGRSEKNALNQAGRRMVGIAADADVSAMKIADMQPPWALDIVSREGVPAALRDGVWSGDTAVVAPDGRQTPVSQVIIAHRTSDGAPEFLSTVARDVTESTPSTRPVR